jgi:putative transcriptional regulator
MSAPTTIAVTDSGIAVHLGKLLVDRGMTAEELADAVGIHSNNISKLRTGDISFIRLETLAKLCRTLECQPGDLLTFKELND